LTDSQGICVCVPVSFGMAELCLCGHWQGGATAAHSVPARGRGGVHHTPPWGGCCRRGPVCCAVSVCVRVCVYVLFISFLCCCCCDVLPAGSGRALAPPAAVLHCRMSRGVEAGTRITRVPPGLQAWATGAGCLADTCLHRPLPASLVFLSQPFRGRLPGVCQGIGSAVQSGFLGTAHVCTDRICQQLRPVAAIPCRSSLNNNNKARC
jgi:hypothetical protein